MSNILGKKTLGTAILYEVDTNPVTGGGTPANIGDFAIAKDGSGFFYKSGPLNTNWQQGVTSGNIFGTNVLIVRKNPTDGQFATINAALATIIGSSITNPFVISVGVGIFTETYIDVASKPYVSIVGTSILSTIIEPDANNHDVINIGVGNEISFLSINNAGAGHYGLTMIDTGNFGQVHKVSFNNCDGNIWIKSITQDTFFYGEYIDFNGIYSVGLKVEATNGFRCFVNMENYYNFPDFASTSIGTYVTGAGSDCNILTSGNTTDSNSSLPSGLGTAFYIQDGAKIEITSTNIKGYNKGIWVGNVGAASNVTGDGILSMSNTTYDIQIQHPSTSGTISGSFDTNKVIIASNLFGIAIQNTMDGSLLITDHIDVLFPNGTKTNVSTLIIEGSTCGVEKGGNLTDGGGFVVNISPGFGYFEQFPDNNVIQRIDWGNFNANPNTYNNTLTYNTLVGIFQVGETITGGTSGATGVVTSNGAGTLRYIPSNSKGFIASETITGGTSAATANVLTVRTSIVLSANVDVYIYFNSNAILVSNGAEPDTRYNILLGRVVTNGVGIEFFDESPSDAEHTSNLLSNNLKNAIGSVYAFGSIVTENVTPLHLNITGGQYYFGENVFMPSSGTNITFTEIYGQGAGIILSQNAINNTQYDNAGVLTALTAGYYAKGSLYLVGDGINQKFYYVFPQQQYNTLLATQQASIPLPPTYFKGSVVLVAGIIIQQGNPNVVQIIDERPVVGFRASGVNASADHESLLNLNAGFYGDGGHTNMFVVSGAKAMTGNLDMGGNNVITAGTFNSVVVEAHASRHLPNGADPLTTAAPNTDLSGSTGNTVGNANSFARSNHTHAIDGAALTKVDDTNVTLTLGGSFSTALLNAASLTLGWAGQLSIARGGTNKLSYTNGSIIYFDGTSLSENNAQFFWDNPTARLFIGANTSINGSNAGIQYSDATTANRGQIKLHSYFNGVSIAGVSTLTSRSGTVGINNAVVAGQDYSKWTAQAAATTIGSAPISGTFAFKANTVNLLTVPSDFHIQLTNLVGTLGDKLYLTSEGLLQLIGYTTGIAHFDGSGNITSSLVSLTADVTGVLPEANGGTNQSIYTIGDILYASAANTLSKLPIGTAGQQLTVVGGIPSWSNSGTGTVTSFSAGNLSPLFTTSVTTPTTTPALSFALSNAAANTWFGNNTGAGASPAYNSAGTVTKLDDTNVTLTLGGTFTNSVLNSFSLTMGWVGLLNGTRGGSGVNNAGTFTWGANNITFITTGVTTLTLPTSGTLLTSATAFVNGGNAFGAAATLGTTDNNDLSIISGTGAINLGTDAASKNITIGNITGATAININAGTGTNTWTTTNGAWNLNTGTGAINIGTDAAAKSINIGNATGATAVTITSGTGNVSIGSGAVAHTVIIGSSVGASAVTISVGTGVLSLGSNGTDHQINLGNATGASPLVINSGSGSSGWTTAGGLITFSTANGGITMTTGTGNINIGADSAAKNIIIGNVTGATSVILKNGTALSGWVTTNGAWTLQTGTGQINFGADAAAKTILIGNNTGATSVQVTAGTGQIQLITTNSTFLVQTGTGAINVGTDAFAKTITIGNVTGATNVIVNSGTGNCQWNTTNGSLSIQTGTGAINVGTDAAAKTITIGNVTGATNVNVNAGTGTCTWTTTNGIWTLATGTGAINFGTDAAAKTITIGNVTGATAVNINSGTGTNTWTTTNGSWSLNTGTGAINFGTDAAVKTITIGNVTGATAVNINSGTGTNRWTTTNGAWALATGTGAINFGTDAAAKTITIGNVTGATAVNINSGTGTNTWTTTNGIWTLATGTGNINIGNDASAKTITIGNSTVNTVLAFKGGSVTYAQTSLSATNTFFTLTQAAHTGGTPTGLLYTGGASTTLTASTETIDINYNLNRIVQHATGALATQRAFVVQAPTYSFVAASTITSAATFAVSGAPVAGTNATLTNSYSIWAQAGDVRFDGTNVNLKHIIGTTAAPAIAAGTGAGTAPTVSITGTDVAGVITVTSGTLPVVSAIIATITFNIAYGVAPIVVLTPANTNAITLSGVSMVGVPASGQTSGVTTTTFNILSGATGLTAATTYLWSYHVIQ